MSTLSFDPALVAGPRASAARRWLFLPLSKNPDGSVTIAVAEPEDAELIANLTALYAAPVIPVRRSRRELESDLQQAFGLAADAFASLPAPQPPPETAERRLSPVAAFVEELIIRALADGATDVHVEPYERELRARFRIDGVLHSVPLPAAAAAHAATIVSRIKVMGGMNVAERRQPQDGRFHFGSDVDVRVSTLPTVHGESVDLRLLPSAERAFDLDGLGLSARDRGRIDAVLARPHGLVLATGPTGHGKTTTLYACLSRINTSERKIITVEDPVEIRLRGVNQVEIRPSAGLTFAAGLRSILRQDPDVIMVGEIRDRETAEIAIRAALTGHLVFSTLHTGDAAGAVARLGDMGIEPYLIADALVCVIGQRLVRRPCPGCGAAAGGCDACRRTGLRGRTGVFEVLSVDDAVRARVMERAGGAALRAAAAAAGMTRMADDGRAKAAAGLTTAAELARVLEAS